MEEWNVGRVGEERIHPPTRGYGEAGNTVDRRHPPSHLRQAQDRRAQGRKTEWELWSDGKQENIGYRAYREMVRQAV